MEEKERDAGESSCRQEDESCGNGVRSNEPTKIDLSEMQHWGPAGPQLQHSLRLQMSAISPIHEYARRARIPVVGKEGALSEGDLRRCTATSRGVAGGKDCGKCARNGVRVLYCSHQRSHNDR